MTETARSRSLSRIRQVSFPGSAFGSTRHAALKKELAERLVCPHIPAGAEIYHWYEHSKDEVHVYLCHFSFDEVKPETPIPVDWDIRLRSNADGWVIAPIGLELNPPTLDKMATGTPSDFRESAPVDFEPKYGWVEVGQYRTPQEAIEEAKKAVADREKVGSDLDKMEYKDASWDTAKMIPVDPEPDEPAKFKTWRDRKDFGFR
jgi:hypothetical protein